MGAAAVPIQIFLIAAGTAISISQSKRQNQLIADQAAADRAKARSQASQQEVQRLKNFRTNVESNILNAADSGFTIEGTPSTFIEAEIAAKDEDLAAVRAGGALTSRNITDTANAQQSINNIGTVGTVISGVAGGASAVSAGSGARAATTASGNL